MDTKTKLFLPSFSKSGAISVALGAFMISFSAVYVKIAHVTPTMSGFYRNFFGGLALSLWLLVKRETPWKGFSYFSLATLCGFLFSLDLYFWHRSVLYIGPGLSTILANFQVFLMTFCGVVLFGERIRMNQILAAPMAMFGLFLLAGIRWNDMGQQYHLGVIFGLTTACAYTCFMLVLRKLQGIPHTPSPSVNMAVVSFAATLFLGVWAHFQGETFYIPDTQSFLALAAYGVFSQAVGWILITKGLPNVRSSLAGLLLLLQPSLSFIWDILLFDRPTTIVDIAGVFLALFAIYLGAAWKQKE